MHTWPLDDFINYFNAKKVQQGFYYNSGENSEWLSVEDIRKLIKQHVDESFEA